jgi:hypothetical protein
LDTSGRDEINNLPCEQTLLCDGLLDEFDRSRREGQRLLDLLMPPVLHQSEIVQKLEHRWLDTLGQLVHQRRGGSEPTLHLLPSRDILCAQVVARQSQQACRSF